MSDERNNGLFGGNEPIDLGSDATFTDLPDFSSDDFDSIFGTAEKKDDAQTESAPVKSETPAPITTEKLEETQTNEETTTVSQSAADAKAEAAESDVASDKSEEQDPFEAALAQANQKQAEKDKSGLVLKLPIFSYANAKEEIIDTSKTFDELRNEKAEDFPELDDATAVSWKMTYGTITKTVSTPKKTTIASLKKQIEESKEFMDCLKKAKGEIECKVIPSVTAKKKGIVSSYKGVFDSVEDAAASGKAIGFVPSDDGKVYEVRANKIGVFISEAEKVSMMRKVRAGFIPALPKIPYSMLSEILSFFKEYVTDTGELEALAYIYWSFADSRYYVHVPKQQVSKASVDSSIPELDEDKFVLVMEIHSHNTMAARFSPTDDRDERATRLYTVVGRMDKVFPDITTRASVGGKYVEIEPETVFEGFDGTFPEAWKDAVDVRKPKFKEAGDL
ncbi:MAG: Mov34/MPN/PAD-1 family protein [Clostridia bacterium]|nr:Mov34/MPN/PAD-1 family protein [Clostridia bacterium]